VVKTIKVSDEEYQRITKAREELSKKGYGKLPLDPEKAIDLGDFTLGAIAALGALALLYLLTRKE